jgi:TetR/AcrR family transcriptional regulator
MADRTTEPSRRERVVAAAIDMFTRYGVRRTSVEDIAAAAQIAKGSVYLEFRGKAELFRAAAEQIVTEILAAADEAAGARAQSLDDRITDVLCAKFWRLHDLVHTRPHAAELIDVKDEVAADLFRTADDRFAALVERSLETDASWRPRAPYTRAEVAAVLLRAAHGVSYGGGKLGAAAFRKRLRLAVGMILDGSRR